MTRLLDLAPRALERLRGAELVEAIRASEGRTIAAETITATGPLLDRVSNPELVAAFGADIIVLNLYDVDHPRIAGMPRRAGDAAPDDATAMGGAPAPAPASTVAALAAPEISADRRRSVAPGEAPPSAAADSGVGTGTEELDWVTSHSWTL